MTIAAASHTDFIEKIQSTSTLLLELLRDSPSLPLLHQLRMDIENNYYTIVTVGEFNNGKSTLINSMLGQPIMPMGILPVTAVIHAVFFGEESAFQIVSKEGVSERKTLTDKSLNDYAAAAKNSDDINYIKVFMSSALLENRVVLVDTPGLNDLNEHRVAVTKKFIPQADAVIFTMDIRQALSTEEYKYLKEIVDEGISQFIFIANFKDTVNEDELEDQIDYMKRRLAGIMKNSQPILIPVSAKMGLEGKQSGNQKMVVYSGISQAEQAVMNLLENGKRQTDKRARYKARIHLLHQMALKEVRQSKAICEADADQLQEYLHSVTDWLDQKESWVNQIDDYIGDRQTEIEAMAEKSVYYLRRKLIKEANDRISAFNGTEIDHFVNIEMSLFITNRIEDWTEQYTPYVEELFSKVGYELSSGLSKSFEQDINIRTHAEGNMKVAATTNPLEVEADHSFMKAGLIVGGTTAALALMGGGILMPVLGMGVLPILQKKIKSQKLEQIKPVIRESVETVIRENSNELLGSVTSYIDVNMVRVKVHCLLQFEKQLEIKQEEIKNQIQTLENEKVGFSERLKRLNQAEAHILEVLKEES